MVPLFNLPSPRTGAEPARWCQLAGSISSLAIADAARADTRPWLVIENGAQALEQRQAELRFYGGFAIWWWTPARGCQGGRCSSHLIPSVASTRPIKPCA